MQRIIPQWFQPFTKWFKKHRTPILALIFVASLICSFIGYTWQLSTPVGTIPPEQTFVGYFRGLSHFTLNSLDCELPEDRLTQFFVLSGRWLAVLFVALSTASIFESVFHWTDGLYRNIHSWGRNKHDILIGCGWKGRNMLQHRPPDSLPCFVVESNPTTKTAETAWHMGVSMVHGDATEKQVLERVRPDKARAIYVCTGKDETNIQVVQELSRFDLLPHTVVCVDLQSQRRFEVLKNSLAPRSAAHIDLRLFNTHAITARSLLKKHALDRFNDTSAKQGAELVVLGEGSMARELVRQAMQHGIFEPGKSLRITWIVENPESASKSFAGHYPCFPPATIQRFNSSYQVKPEAVWSYERGAGVLPEVDFHQLPTSSQGFLSLFETDNLLQGDGWATGVYVACDDPTHSAKLASLIAPTLGVLRSKQRDVELYFYFNTRERTHREAIESKLRETEKSLTNNGNGLPIYAFSDFLGECSMQSVRGDVLDKAARRINGIYQMDAFREWLTKSAASGGHPEWNEAAATMSLDRLIELKHTNSDPLCLLRAFAHFCDDAWRACSEADKESNRQAAAHAGVKERIRARLRNAGQEHVHALAVVEHRRWCAEYLLRGFRPLTRIPSDPNSPKPFTRTLEESDAIDSWFGANGKAKNKALQKSLMRHVDLIPFDDFTNLFTEDRAKKEEAKDEDQIRALDIILGD